MQQIPLQPVPSQILNVVLASQNCQIAVYQKTPCIFVDLNVAGVDISVGVQARDSIALNPNIYEGFVGNLILMDTQGDDDPVYTGLGSRWVLLYLTGDEYAQISN